MSLVLSLPSVDTARGRMNIALLFAILLHALLLFGLGLGRLNLTATPREILPTLEVTLVITALEKPPEKPDYLAQFNQEGSGNSKAEPRAESPPPAPAALTPEPAPKAEPPAPLPEPAPETQPMAPLPEPDLPPPTPSIEAQPPPLPPNPIKHELKALSKKASSPKPKPGPKAATRAKSQHSARAEEATKDLPSAAQIFGSGVEIASLSARIDESQRNYAQRPRQKFISARTQEYKYASYMEAWRVKVEHVGNLNYPDEAKRHNLSGSLILDVALNADGSINMLTLLRSSGHKVLDDAAAQIVRLAAPYASFPAAIRKDADVLHITRTWQFLRDNRLESQ